jgi:hypothetical protein
MFTTIALWKMAHKMLGLFLALSLDVERGLKNFKPFSKNVFCQGVVVVNENPTFPNHVIERGFSHHTPNGEG